jgi:hypothetical protein
MLIVVLLLVLLFFNWGVRTDIIDFKLFVTLWVAEVPIAVFLRYILTEGRHDKPILDFAEKEDKYEKEGVLHHGLLVMNRGEVGAQSCEGHLTLNANADDVLDTPGAIVTKQDFLAIRDERMCWKTGDVELSIKPGKHEFLEVVSLRKPTEGSELGLEVPSAKGQYAPLVALKAKDYVGSVRILSMNSRPLPLEFDILYTKKDGTIKIDF